MAHYRQEKKNEKFSGVKKRNFHEKKRTTTHERLLKHIVIEDRAVNLPYRKYEGESSRGIQARMILSSCNLFIYMVKNDVGSTNDLVE